MLAANNYFIVMKVSNNKTAVNSELLKSEIVDSPGL